MCVCHCPVIQAISIPVVVVVHGIQQSSAEATIFWDNYFAESVRNSYEAGVCILLLFLETAIV